MSRALFEFFDRNESYLLKFDFDLFQASIQVLIYIQSI